MGQSYSCWVVWPSKIVFKTFTKLCAPFEKDVLKLEWFHFFQDIVKGSTFDHKFWFLYAEVHKNWLWNGESKAWWDLSQPDDFWKFWAIFYSTQANTILADFDYFEKLFVQELIEDEFIEEELLEYTK